MLGGRVMQVLFEIFYQTSELGLDVNHFTVLDTLEAKVVELLLLV